MFNGNNSGVGGRQVGVQIPAGQRREPTTGKPETLMNLIEAKSYGVQYVDTNGNIIKTMIMSFGESWYIVPNGESFVGSLKPINGKSWLVQQAKDKLSALTPTVVPSEDTVDITGGG